MCGIVGYCGPERRSLPHDLVRLLADLEYRGYDSAGVVSVAPSGLTVVKVVGSVVRLAERLRGLAVPAATVALAHTRWATHGIVSEANAHPLVSPDGALALVMNGVVENDQALRDALGQRGVTACGEGDAATVLSAVQAQLASQGDGDLTAACAVVLGAASGRLAFCVASRARPDLLVLARRGSPLFVGRAGLALWIASDPAALPPSVTAVFELDDGATVPIVRGRTTAAAERGWRAAGVPVRRSRPTRGAFGSFLEKEILEQGASVERAVEASLDGPALPGASGWGRVVLLGCGSAHHAGLAAKHAFERWARLPAEAVLANEFLGTEPVLDAATLVVAVSQSGETADTLAAAMQAAAAGATVVALTNAPGSGLARLARYAYDLAAGPEVSVASTKAYTGMLVRLTLLAADLGVRRGALSAPDYRAVVAGARQLGAAVAAVARTGEAARLAAERWRDREAYLFMGRGLDYPTALEGALKLRELSYRQAQGIAAGELKHGTLALVARGYPVVALAVDQRVRARMITGIREVQARGADVLAVIRDGDAELRSLVPHALVVPATADEWAPVLGAVPLQWLALHAATGLGRDLDRPRNLAKSVTVV